MRFAGNTSNVGSWIQAGKAGAKGVADAFKVARSNAPDYGGLGEARQNARSKERQVATAAESAVAQAGLKAMSEVQSTKVKTDAQLKVLDTKLKAKRMAGMVGMLGTAVGGAFLGMENNKAAAKQAERDAIEERRHKERLEVSSRDTSVEVDIPEFKPTKPPGSSDDSSTDGPSDTSSDSPSDTAGTQFPADGFRGEVYSYLTKDKGLSSNQALGLMANIDRESSFRIAPPGGDNGNSFGMFQWNNTYGRSDKMKAAVPDWQTNWKGQIDFALGDQQLPEYNTVSSNFKNTQFGSAQEAADYWMTHWERPADIAGGSAKHKGFLSGYKFK